jgi:hypothetical protein
MNSKISPKRQGDVVCRQWLDSILIKMLKYAGSSKTL